MKNSFWAVLRENKIGVEMEKKKNIKQSQNKVILNLIQDLPHKLFMNKTTLSGRFRIGVRNDFMDKQQTARLEDPGVRAAPASSGMTLCDSGFTLIELLVVVLIIGILAAVALPQYQLAVEKSRATQAVLSVKKLAEAMELYYLANGSYPTETTLDELNAKLDIEVNVSTSNFTFWRASDYVSFSRNGLNYYVIAQTLPHRGSSDARLDRGITCNIGAKQDDGSLSARLCKSLCKTDTLKSVWGSGQYGCEFQ